MSGELFCWAWAAATVCACHSAGPPPDAQYPALQLPVRLAPESAPPPLPASSPNRSAFSNPQVESSPAAAARGDLPDPPPLSQRAQWAYSVEYDRGSIRVGEPAPVCLTTARGTARRIGRFAFELWLGRELIERVRFDFPLLAAETPRTGPRKPLRETPSFASGARVSVNLQVPASERATSARILDRASRDSVVVPWPPRITDSSSGAHTCPPVLTRADVKRK